MDNQSVSQRLQAIYDRLFAVYGPQHWWPARERFEVIIGAILTQSAAWTNVEKAMTNLRAAGAVSPAALRTLPRSEITKLIHPCGYYNAKALKLKSFAGWMGERYQDNLDKLFGNGVDHLREELLSVYGIGQETADSIMLYAGNKPIFVVDAYTRRIISRVGLGPERDSYNAYQAYFMAHLPPDYKLFNEYHALLVNLAKNVCRPEPHCKECCLNDLCENSKSAH
ncbi:MAG: endonuclease [Dehalococcoidales bacterium]|nr:endonuclease [Dehalococcoidales bacterium]